MAADKKSRKKTDRVKDLKSKKLDARRASEVKGGSLTDASGIDLGFKLAEPRPDPFFPLTRKK